MTEVADMFLVFHCKSFASDQIPICAGLLLRITPGNSIDVGECVDVEQDIIGSLVVPLIVDSRHSCVSTGNRSFGQGQLAVLICLH